jgi:hypothetical protein
MNLSYFRFKSLPYRASTAAAAGSPIHNSHTVVSKLFHGNLDFLFLPDFRLVEKNAVNKSLQACSWIPSLTSTR